MSCDCAIQWPAAKSHNEWGKKVHYIYTYGAGVVHIGHNFVYRNGRRRLNNFTSSDPLMGIRKKHSSDRHVVDDAYSKASLYSMMIYIIFVSELLIFPRIQKRRGTTTTMVGVWGPRMGQMGVKSMRRRCECIILKI